MVRSRLNRERLLPLAFAALLLLCPLLAGVHADRLLSLPSLTGPPSIPAYQGWQNVRRRTEHVGQERLTITTFETPDESAQIARFYNAHFGKEGWWDRLGTDYLNPIEWQYDHDYCPFTVATVKRTTQPSGLTHVEVRVSEESCVPWARFTP